MGELVSLGFKSLPETIAAGRTGKLPSMGTLDAHMRSRKDTYLGPIYTDVRRSNQWLSIPQKGKSFREANPKDDGIYNVLAGPDGETHRIRLPKTMQGPDGREIVVADARGFGASFALDGIILACEFDPKKGEHGEYLYTLSDPSKWFGICMPEKNYGLEMVLDETGVLKGFKPFVRSGESGLAVKRPFFIAGPIPPSIVDRESRLAVEQNYTRSAHPLGWEHWDVHGNWNGLLGRGYGAVDVSDRSTHCGADFVDAVRNPLASMRVMVEKLTATEKNLAAED